MWNFVRRVLGLLIPCSLIVRLFPPRGCCLVGSLRLSRHKNGCLWMDLAPVAALSDWESKGPCAIVPLTWKMAHQSLCRLIRKGPFKISKSLEKAENGPLAKTSSQSLSPNTLIFLFRLFLDVFYGF